MKKNLDIYLLESKVTGSHIVSSIPAGIDCEFLKTVGIASGVEIDFEPYQDETNKEAFNAKLQKQIDDLEARKL